MQILKTKDLSLLNGTYVVKNEGSIPVFNQGFYDAQKQAEYVMLFAEKAKGKDFVGKKADSLLELREEIKAELHKKSVVEYIPTPTEPAMPYTNAAKSEALAFLDYHDSLSKTEKINQFMQRFNALFDAEQVGIPFTEGIMRLSKIYTTQDIKSVITEVVDLLS